MVDLGVGASNPAARERLQAMFRQRHDIFIKEKGWQLTRKRRAELKMTSTGRSDRMMVGPDNSQSQKRIGSRREVEQEAAGMFDMAWVGDTYT